MDEELEDIDEPLADKTGENDLAKLIAAQVLAAMPQVIASLPSLLNIHFEGVEYVIVEGKDGPIGPKGDIGPGGARGEAGERGDMGPRGEAGRDGSPGEPGERGEKGDEGPQGIPGRDGDPGIQGIQGERGEQGAPGEPGRDGKDGREGTDGPAGKPGKDGKNATVKDVLKEIEKSKSEAGVRIGGTRPLGRASTLSIISATETPNGVRTTFTFAQKPLILVADNGSYLEGDRWTWSGSTATVTPAPNNTIYGMA